MWKNFANRLQDASAAAGGARPVTAAAANRGHSQTPAAAAAPPPWQPRPPQQQQQQQDDDNVSQETSEDLLIMLAREEEQLKREEEEMFGFSPLPTTSASSTGTPAAVDFFAEPALVSENDDDDEPQDYIPESLASFVEQADVTLQKTQQHFLAQVDHDNVMLMLRTASEESDGLSPRHMTMHEDENDRKLKGEILGSLEQQRQAEAAEALWSPDVFTSPPALNPVNNMSHTEIKRQATGEAFFTPQAVAATPAAAVAPAAAGTGFWSPDLFASPPPNPVQHMTNSEIRREATADTDNNNNNGLWQQQPDWLDSNNTPAAGVVYGQEDNEDQQPMTHLANTLQMQEPEMEFDFEPASPDPPHELESGNEQQQQNVVNPHIAITHVADTMSMKGIEVEYHEESLHQGVNAMPEQEMAFFVDETHDQQQQQQPHEEQLANTMQLEEEPEIQVTFGTPLPTNNERARAVTTMDQGSARTDQAMPPPTPAVENKMNRRGNDDETLTPSPLSMSSSVSTSPPEDPKMSASLRMTPAARTLAARTSVTPLSARVAARTTRVTHAPPLKSTPPSASPSARAASRTTPSSAQKRTTPSSARTTPPSRILQRTTPPSRTTPSLTTRTTATPPSAARTTATPPAVPRTAPPSVARTTTTPPSSGAARIAASPPSSGATRTTPVSTAQKRTTPPPRTTLSSTIRTKATPPSRTTPSSPAPLSASHLITNTASSRARIPGVAPVSSRLTRATAASRAHTISTSTTKPKGTSPAVSSSKPANIGTTRAVTTPSTAPVADSSSVPSAAVSKHMGEGVSATAAVEGSSALQPPAATTMPPPTFPVCLSPLTQDTIDSSGFTPSLTISNPVGTATTTAAIGGSESHPAGATTCAVMQPPILTSFLAPTPSTSKQVEHGSSPAPRAVTNNVGKNNAATTAPVRSGATPPPIPPPSPVGAPPASSKNAVLQSTTTTTSKVTLTGQAGVSSRLLQETATSHARSAALTEGQAKALERLRQKKKTDLQKAKASGLPTTRRLSDDMGIARSRARVRQREVGKRTAAQQQTARQSIAGARPWTGSAVRPLTIAKSPNFATSTRLGERTGQTGKDKPTLAQSSDFLRKGLRDETLSARGPPTTKAIRPRLTVPKAPNFATTARCGEPKPRPPANSPPLARSSDLLMMGLREDRSSLAGPLDGSVRPPKSLPTIPQAPHFATTDRHGEKVVALGAPSFTLAQSSDMLQKGLRQTIPSIDTRWESRPELTVPHTPQFHSSAKRELPMSTAESENEMMDYYNSHPFKAMPVAKVPGQSVRRKSSNFRLTVPEPFHFRTEERVPVKKPVVRRYVSKKKSDEEEIKTEFRARPMPNFSEPPAQIPKTAEKRLTQPVPFELSTNRTSPEHRIKTPDEIELERQFHAKPIPKSTYEYEAPVMSPRSLESGLSIVTHVPSLATADRSERRNAAAQAFERKAEQLVLQREQEQKARQRNAHIEAMKKAELALPRPTDHCTNPVPFALATDARHENHQKQLEEKLKQEEEKRLREMKFHARSFTVKPVPVQKKIRSEKAATQPRPFQLPGTRLHERSQEEQRRKLAEMEEERKRQAAFRAKPVPKTTYTPYKPAPEREHTLVDPFSPELCTKQRAVERQAFDVEAEQKRAAEEGRKRAIQEQLAADEEADLQERRRLPVSEGGMIPTAEPVNAVLYDQTGDGSEHYQY